MRHCRSGDDGLSNRRGQGAVPPGGKGVHSGAKHFAVTATADPVGGRSGSQSVGKTARAAPAWQELWGERHIPLLNRTIEESHNQYY